LTDVSAQEVTVAAVNFSGAWGDKEENLARIERWLREASEAGVQIACFPELALSGYECDEALNGDGPCALHLEAAETIPGPATERLQRTCGDLGIYAIVGMPERDPEHPDRLYLSAAVIGPEGVLGAHRKTIVVGEPLYTESACFQPGSGVSSFETQFGPIGVLICYEFSLVPELARLAYLQGARIIFGLNSSPTGEAKPEFFRQQTAARATDSLIYAVGCNRVGRENKREYYGHSTIAGPRYPRLSEILASGGDGEELVAATLDLSALEAWPERHFDPRSQANWQLIARAYGDVADGS
jgi:predicted amidohydrolase